MKQQERKQVLVIDDDKSILKSLSDFLSFKGFDVVVAESGEEGLDKIAITKPDIILLDVSMPGMGGIGFLKRIMASNGSLQYPVLVFTARTTTEEFFRGIAVDGFIAKPCDNSELAGKINEILEKRNMNDLKTILIGEDDKMVADSLVKVFSDAGFDVEKVETGPKVLEKAAVFLPKVILIKQILTGMNGDLVASILQAMPRTQSIPVVLYHVNNHANNNLNGLARKREEDDHLRRIQGIKKCLATNEAFELLNAVKEVLHVTSPDQGA